MSTRTHPLSLQLLKLSKIGLAGNGEALIVMVTEALTAGQGDWPVLVSVSVTVPAAISPDDGPYAALSTVAAGENVPVPEEVQVPPVAPPPTVPPKPAVLLPAEIVWLPPALAVAAWRTAIATVAVAAPQGDCWPVLDSVSVTVPVEASASDGV